MPFRAFFSRSISVFPLALHNTHVEVNIYTVCRFKDKTTNLYLPETACKQSCSGWQCIWSTLSKQNKKKTQSSRILCIMLTTPYLLNYCHESSQNLSTWIPQHSSNCIRCVPDQGRGDFNITQPVYYVYLIKEEETSTFL